METMMIFTIGNQALDNDDNNINMENNDNDDNNDNMDNTSWQENNGDDITLKASKLLVRIDTFLQACTRHDNCVIEF